MKKTNIFLINDIRQIKGVGISLADVEQQLKSYRLGANYLKLIRPCMRKDGIISIGPASRKELISHFEKQSGNYKLIKFVPASGAASRMFADWFTACDKASFASSALDRKIMRDLSLFPFFPLIANHPDGKKLLQEKNTIGLLGFILTATGLNYGNQPKALIPFHRYPQNEIRTGLEEHLTEAAAYLCGTDTVCHLHFTISPEHKKAISKYLKKVIRPLEKTYQIKFNITFSIQDQATNTIAVDDDNRPLRDARGRLIFRPAGHGALLANLNAQDADFIFVKNIDNVAPRPLLKKNLPFKKMLAGLAMTIQEEIFSLLLSLESEELSTSEIDDAVNYCTQKLNITFPPAFSRKLKKEKIQTIFSLLNRPLRICGMVKNFGEPGGGPFWVEEKDGKQTLQIVEGGHVDKNNSQQLAIWLQAQYFNPVDMVCCIKDYRGNMFNLDCYVNKDAYLITAKNEKGIRLKALEMPGLWNGGMAYWNTVFVELPISVFNPVKTVYDLLRPEHLATT